MFEYILNWGIKSIWKFGWVVGLEKDFSGIKID
jgi:hypothetical protein